MTTKIEDFLINVVRAKDKKQELKPNRSKSNNINEIVTENLMSGEVEKSSNALTKKLLSAGITDGIGQSLAKEGEMTHLNKKSRNNENSRKSRNLTSREKFSTGDDPDPS